MNNKLGKYKGLLMTLVFFLVFFLIFSLFNLYLGSSLNSENDRLQSIRLMQTQAADIQQKLNQNQNFTQSAKAMENTANALKSGGTVGDTTLPSLDPSIDTSTIDALMVNIKQLQESGDTASASRLETVNTQLNTLAQQWAGIIEKKTQRFKILQYAAMALALIYFLGIVFQLVRNFDNIDSEVEMVKGETENILGTVNEGLFLITSDFEIGAQQSKALKGIFGLKENIEGNFLEFLKRYVPEKSLEIAEDFISLLFGKRVKENLIDDLNPLKKVEINLERRDGSFESHYINFDFKRVMEDKEIKYILGSVTDVTQEVLLERELEETKEQSEAQIDLFMSVLHVPPKQLELFIDLTNTGIKDINNILKDTEDKNYKGKVETIARTVHKIKGDAAILNLHSFESKAHEFEEVISQIQENPTLKGEDLLPLAVQLKGMIGHQESFQDIFQKFDTNKQVVRQNAEQATTDSAEVIATAPGSELAALVQRLGNEYDKHIGLFEYGNVDDVATDIAEKVRDCEIQLLRNAVTHGIESTSKRKSLNKSNLANIWLSRVVHDDRLEVSVKDDGAGINIDAIRHKALEKGLFSEEVLNSMPDRKVVGLIFNPNFSTKEDADMNAGRGVGLNLVRQIIKELNGKISINWEENKFTAFKLTIPLTNNMEDVV